MRRRLWLQFHLWTIGLVAALTVANVVFALRPYPSIKSPETAAAIQLGGSPSADLIRQPASDTANLKNSALDSRLALKTTQVGCDANLRLRVVTAVRQVRLQFDRCASKSSDDIAGVQNKTNGFEATIFGYASAAPKTEEAMAGTFSTPTQATADSPAPAKSGKKVRKPAAENVISSEPISTDYITLAPGDNEIAIHRSGREQVLKIERK